MLTLLPLPYVSNLRLPLSYKDIHDWNEDSPGLSRTIIPSPCGSAGKESACNAGDLGSIPGLGRSTWEDSWEKRLPTPVIWPGEFHELYSPWGHKELDTTEQLSLSRFVITSEKNSFSYRTTLTESGN